MSTITAIVPTYNRRQFLGEAIDGILGQTRPVDQIIVWDDGSTDGTEAEFGPMAATSGGRIVYRRVANGGKSRALNAALAEAHGDLIWICDDDDIALPHAAERLGGLLDRGPAGMAAGGHDRFTDDPVTGARGFHGRGYWPDTSRGSVLRHVLEDVFFFQNAALVRRAAFDRVGPFREDLARSIDYEMFVRLASRFPVALEDEAMFHQRKHDGARGPAAARHDAGSSEAVWRRHDREIFARFRDVLPLSLYAAFFEAEDPRLAARAGRLQRGCVYARRTDWPAAIEDFRAAAEMTAAGPLTACERDILIRAMAGKHGAEDAYTRPIAGMLSDLRRVGPLGAAMARCLARGTLWRIRRAASEGAWTDAAAACLFIARMGGPVAAGATGSLEERRELPKAAYDW